MDEKDSFAAALKKAREIAAKMQVNTKPVTSGPLEKTTEASSGEADPDSKKKLALQIASSLSKKLPKNIRVLSEGINKDGEMVLHMMIPAMLVCLFAGKDNETVNWLRKSNMVKVEMNLEHPYASTAEKPLTITGAPDKVEATREAVNRYIREKDELLGINANNLQMVVGIDYSELPIPKEAVGLVIGKQGENIKKINNETGCVVKFRPLTQYDDDRFRICTFHGTSVQVKKAREQMAELTEYIKQKYGLSRPVPKPGQELVEVRVSAQKAGIVIGKGGETIKQINNLSGAIVCIDRSIPENADFRIFFVCGTPEQIDHAKYLIREKSGEATEMPEMEYMSFNPFAEGFDNLAPRPPPFVPAFLPAMMVPQYPFDPNAGLQPSMNSYQANFQPAPNMQPNPYQGMQQPPVSQPSSHEQSKDASQDATAAWNAYYQQYYAHFYQQQGVQQPHQGDADPNNPTPTSQPQDYTQYWQAYYQQLYSQNPEAYQQAMAQAAQQAPNPHPQPYGDRGQSQRSGSRDPSVDPMNNYPQGHELDPNREKLRDYVSYESSHSKNENVITQDYGHMDTRLPQTPTPPKHFDAHKSYHTRNYSDIDRSPNPIIPEQKVTLTDYHHHDTGSISTERNSREGSDYHHYPRRDITPEKSPENNAVIDEENPDDQPLDDYGYGSKKGKGVQKKTPKRRETRRQR